jgi:uncharacterized membrane-anchored protein
MNIKKWMLTAFVLVVIAQWYVPAKMIIDREGVLRSGKDYKFKVAPVDPTDPFRGKYITLNFSDTRYPVPVGEDWRPGEDIYVVLTTNPQGFASIWSVSKETPRKEVDFIKAKVGFVIRDSTKTIQVRYPFDRFYLEESKAPGAERVYNETIADTAKQAYALVSIQADKAVLKDVLIDGVSIKELAKNRQHD